MTATIFINKNCGLRLPVLSEGDIKGETEDTGIIQSIKTANFIFLMRLGLNVKYQNICYQSNPIFSGRQFVSAFPLLPESPWQGAM